MENNKNFVIFNQKTAAYLMNNGCQLKKVEPSKKNPLVNVFIFANNETVLKLVEQYSRLKNKSV
jgi:hypothetical protein